MDAARGGLIDAACAPSQACGKRGENERDEKRNDKDKKENHFAVVPPFYPTPCGVSKQ
jgi:hypothetical protein